jgi:hypothetical protein
MVGQSVGTPDNCPPRIERSTHRLIRGKTRPPWAVLVDQHMPLPPPDPVTQAQQALTRARTELSELEATLSETDELIASTSRLVAESRKLLHQLRAIEGDSPTPPGADDRPL